MINYGFSAINKNCSPKNLQANDILKYALIKNLFTGRPLLKDKGKNLGYIFKIVKPAPYKCSATPFSVRITV